MKDIEIYINTNDRKVLHSFITDTFDMAADTVPERIGDYSFYKGGDYTVTLNPVVEKINKSSYSSINISNRRSGFKTDQDFARYANETLDLKIVFSTNDRNPFIWNCVDQGFTRKIVISFSDDET